MRRIDLPAACLPLLLCAWICLAAGLGIAGTETTISGILEPVTTDDSDAVTAMVIYDPEYGTVLIRNEGKGAELLNHAWEEASVTGTLESLDDDPEYSLAITVSRYVLLEQATEEELDPENEDPDTDDRY